MDNDFHWFPYPSLSDKKEISLNSQLQELVMAKTLVSVSETFMGIWILPQEHSLLLHLILNVISLTPYVIFKNYNFGLFLFKSFHGV